MTPHHRQRYVTILVLFCAALVLWSSYEELQKFFCDAIIARKQPWSASSLDSGSAVINPGSSASFLRMKKQQSPLPHHHHEDLSDNHHAGSAAKNATTIDSDPMGNVKQGTVSNVNQSTINEVNSQDSPYLSEQTKAKEDNKSSKVMATERTSDSENVGADTVDNEPMHGSLPLIDPSTDSVESLRQPIDSAVEQHTRERIKEVSPIVREDNATDANQHNSTAHPYNANSSKWTGSNSVSALIPVQPDATAAQRIRDTVRKYVEPLQNCNPTAQVRLILPQNGSLKSQWILQSVDEFGRDKTVGGDEYYITYQQQADQEHYDLAAIQTDNNDGTYTLDFVTVPMNPHPPTLAAGGVLRIYFQFTCNLGRVPYPLKAPWKNGGSTLVIHLMSDVPQAPPYREFVPPNRDGSINFASYQLVISFGDSLMYQLVKPLHVPAMNNTCYRDNVNSTLEISTLPHFLEELEEWHGKALRSSNATHKVALLLGSSVWDASMSSAAQGASFDDHIEACRQLVMTAQKLYPKADIYWKSASALHPHRADQHCYESHACHIAYQTSSRIGHLYVRQKALMKELGIPHLDVHEALYLSADYTKPGDIRHFQDVICLMVEGYFYSGFDFSSWRHMIRVPS